MVTIKNHDMVSTPLPEIVNQCTVHTDALFDSHIKAFVHNTSLTVDKSTGLVTKVFERTNDLFSCMKPGDIVLSGLYIMPGFVDAHAHIFLHPYKYTFPCN